MNEIARTLKSQHQHLAGWGAGRDPKSLIEVSDRCIDEMDLIVRTFARADAAVGSLPLPAMRDLAAGVRTELLAGSGFVVVDRLPAQRFTEQQNKLVVRALASLVAPLMVQDKQGTTLYDVMDMRGGAGSNRRRSTTNLEQPFHTDGGWFDPPPQFVGLYCYRMARHGGASLVASVLHMLQSLLDDDRRPELAWLQEPVYWNRMGEQDDHESPYSVLPMLQLGVGGALCSRFYADYVRGGHRLAGQVVPDALEAAVAAVNQRFHANPYGPFQLQPGQLLYLNNWHVVHARSGFEDASDEWSNPGPGESDGGRHLFRVWNTRVSTSA